MVQITQELEQGRIENERRVSDYRALVALLCAEIDREAVPVERVTRTVVVTTVIALIAWAAWKVLQ